MSSERHMTTPTPITVLDDQSCVCSVHMKMCVDILNEGWLLVSCSCSSSSAKEAMKELSVVGEEEVVLLQEEGGGGGLRKDGGGLEQPGRGGSHPPVRVQVERPQQAA